MPATVFTHFFDEELLLPYWLRHHRELFDHGVLVDRGSTDRSLEIIRELVPDWEVVPSRNPLFDARDTDLEMMGLERRYGGWKIILNVTELLLGDDLAAHLDAAPEPVLGVPCRWMVDAPAERGTELDERPLFLQRHHHVTPDPRPLRFLHRRPHGAYAAGRHSVARPFVVDDELVVLKYLWSPYPQIRDRRLQIAQGIPEADLRLGMSWGLFFTGEELDEQFALQSAAARDLRDDPVVAPILERLSAGYRPRTPAPVPRLDPDPRRRIAIQGSAVPGLGSALAAAHDVSATLGDAEIVVTDLEHRAALGVAAALVVDVTGRAPADADEQVLLRGDFFLWDAANVDDWMARFTEVGRLGDPPAPELLGAAVERGAAADVVAAALEPFLVEPRRTTARVAQDSTLPASRIAYRHRHDAALRSVLDTALRNIELANENARLRAELERLSRP